MSATIPIALRLGWYQPSRLGSHPWRLAWYNCPDSQIATLGVLFPGHEQCTRIALVAFWPYEGALDGERFGFRTDLCGRMITIISRHTDGDWHLPTPTISVLIEYIESRIAEAWEEALSHAH